VIARELIGSSLAVVEEERNLLRGKPFTIVDKPISKKYKAFRVGMIQYHDRQLRIQFDICCSKVFSGKQNCQLRAGPGRAHLFLKRLDSFRVKK